MPENLYDVKPYTYTARQPVALNLTERPLVCPSLVHKPVATYRPVSIYSFLGMFRKAFRKPLVGVVMSVRM
jgi:hypothetical protein